VADRVISSRGQEAAMDVTKVSALVLLVFASAGLEAASPPAANEELARPFAYDARQPLEVKQTLLFERAGVRIYDLQYPSPKSGTVTGYLVVPAGKGRFAGLVFGHWGPGNRTEFLPEAQLYGAAGAVSVMIDYPWVRPAPWRVAQGRGFSGAEKDRDSWVAAVVDLRRAIDLLCSRPDVDAERIGYVGHSYGAQWGAILSAVDRRVKAAVLVGGVATAESLFQDGGDPDLLAIRDATPKEELQRYWEVNRPCDGIRYVPYAAPTALFFQFARYERTFDEASMNRYFAAASEPKQVRWYETGHDLNDLRVLADRAAWLQHRLRLAPVRPILEKQLDSDVK